MLSETLHESSENAAGMLQARIDKKQFQKQFHKHIQYFAAFTPRMQQLGGNEHQLLSGCCR